VLVRLVKGCDSDAGSCETEFRQLDLRKAPRRCRGIDSSSRQGIPVEIRSYASGDEQQVISLWERSGLTRPWNDPRKDIARKLRVQPELFLVAVEDGAVVGSVMGGYDGHRAWMYYVAVDERLRKTGIGSRMIGELEQRLSALGCPKVNLQVRGSNRDAAGFYTSLGYAPDDVLSFGKRLEHDVAEGSD
jgi:ribosomal protein S18 acetylase RimI-like enzyme